MGENGGRFSLELGFRSFPELIAACCSIWLSEQHFEARISTITSSRDENDFYGTSDSGGGVLTGENSFGIVLLPRGLGTEALVPWKQEAFAYVSRGFSL